MFREMRRKRQALSEEESRKILYRNTSGVLAVAGEDGYPYAVPLSYVYDGSKIYFHCAGAGHKLDAIRRDNRVSFCVTDLDQVVPEAYTAYYRSVIAFGTVRELHEAGEKRRAIQKLAARYSPDDEAGREKEIEREFSAVCMVEMTIDHMTGKQAVELMREKNGLQP